MMDRHEVQNQVNSIQWFHQMDLGNGIITPGVYDPRARLSAMHIPDDLSGKTVLDIGSWDGFYAFEAERRGASHVLATDSFVWQGHTWGSKAGFELARKALNSQVEDLEIDILGISPETIAPADVVFFLGVLYHMRYPLRALDNLFSVTKKLAIVETVVDLTHMRRPAAAFYPGRELNGDPTNWWAPNEAAVHGLLKTAGFSRVETVHRDAFHHRIGRAIRHKRKGGTPLRHGLSRSRMVFHARP
jgi:tRNA (mo5U34)-methyltransferase